MPKPKKPESEKLVRQTVSMQASIMERAKNAVYYLPGKSFSGLCARAIKKEVERLERTYNKKKPFKDRKGAKLTPGPKI